MSEGSFVQSTSVGLVLARRLVDAACAAAAERGLALAIVVVDAAGHPVLSARMDGAQLCAMPLAADKAYTAAACGLPTAAWAERTQPGAGDWGLNTALGGRLIAFAGGLALYSGRAIVGGIGVSGAKAHDDAQVAQAAATAVGLSTTAS